MCLGRVVRVSLSLLLSWRGSIFVTVGFFWCVWLLSLTWSGSKVSATMVVLCVRVPLPLLFSWSSLSKTSVHCFQFYIKFAFYSLCQRTAELPRTGGIAPLSNFSQNSFLNNIKTPIKIFIIFVPNVRN